MLEPATFIAPLGTWKMDVEKSECQVECWWWCWWWWWWWWRDTAKGLLPEETHQAYGESSLWGGRRGGALIVVVMWLQLGWFMNRGRAWNWTFIAEQRYLDPKRGHPTIAMVDHHLVYLKSHLEVYCLTHASCGEKNTVSDSTNPKVAFAVPMDARTCHFHRTVGYGANGCRKIRIASRMMIWW